MSTPSWHAALKSRPSKWMCSAVAGRASSDRATSLPASRPTLVMRFTNFTLRSLPSGVLMVRLAMGAPSKAPAQLGRSRGAAWPRRDLGFDGGDVVVVGVDHAVGIQGPEKA